MTFSDAEEDQPSGIQSGTATTPNGVSTSSDRPDSNAATSDNQEVTEDIQPEESQSPSLTKEAASSSCNTTSASSNSVTASPTTSSSIGAGSVNQSNFTPRSMQNGTSEAAATNHIAEPEASGSGINTSQPDTSQPTAEEAISVDGGERGLETEKVMEKLQQIHGYIQQTSTAMQALENEGDLNKIGQYNTLVKCMRELKKSEGKLTSHLNKLKAKPSQSELASHGSLVEQFEALYNSLQYQENECVEILSNTLLTDLNTAQPASKNASETNPSGRGSGTSSGSASIGVVGNMNGDQRHLSMQDRLARHETEQIQLSERLRDSLIRRQELMARYQATRERLNNLKRQRQGLVHEERRLLQTVGPETPYEDPIPGADSWTMAQLENAIRDFEGLRTKVDNLHQVYLTKMQAIDETDSEARSELQRKIDQIINKRGQIENALTQMGEILQAKRLEQQAEAEESAADPVPEPVNTASGEDSLPENNNTRESENPVENIQAPEDEDLEPEGAVGMSTEAANIAAKQRHLQSLKNQLATMKRLLHASEGGAITDQEPLTDSEFMQPEASDDGQEDSQNLIDSTIVGVNGEVIHLTETERRNPQVVSKFQELSQAKRRLAKMEEIMEKIAEARQSGRTLTEVLSPENMAILNEAREEEKICQESRSSNLNELRETSQIAEVNFEGSRASNETPRHSTQRDSSIPCNTPPRKNQINRNQEKSPSGRPQWEREREISAMQYHLKKKTPQIPPVNEGFQIGREKEALKKQTRDLLNENGGDPRLMEVITLQEELKEKKNALEALMRRMGKSSSFTLDNISDNISENVSDDAHSDTTDKLASVTWGLPPTRGSNRSFRDHSEAEEEEENFANANGDVFLRSGLAAAHISPDSSPRQHHSLPRPPPPPVQPKNRNRLTPPKMQQQHHLQQQHVQQQEQQQQQQQYHQQQRNAEVAGLFSVNNLGSGSLPKSVRPKHNRYSGRNVPTTSWENLVNGNVSSSQTPPSSNKVQNTVAAALSQLGQVQDTINSLYGELRTAEMTTRQQEVPILNPYASNTVVPPQPPFATSTVTQNLLPNYAMSPLPNTQGRGDLGASNHILAGLQQCFSQLYLHSLEIQSLSKHLQIIDHREKSLSPPHQRVEQRGGSVERRGERAPAPARRENETPQQNFRVRLNPNFHVPHFDDRKDESYLDREEYLLNPQANEGFPRNGVTNPLYVRLCNAQQHQPSSWQLDASEEIDLELAKNFSPFDGSASDGGQPLSNAGGDLLLDSSTHFPFEAEEINDELPWTTVSSPQIHQPSSDILNNQVLPGTRANNYWDNFRSYSRQNPLSTTAKSNTGEQLSLSGSSTPGRTQSLNTASTQLQHSMGFENKNRHFNVTPYPNNSINKASDKNSSSSRSQNKGGARSRYPSHQTNGRKPPLANSLYQHNAATPSSQHFGTDSCKRNNRPDLRVPFEMDGFTQLEATPNLGCASGEVFFNVNASPLRFNNSRRFARERGGPLPRSTEENSAEFCSTRNTNLRRPNAASHDEDPGALDTFSRVVREAESLMQKHSQQPHFLLQLFHHASKITSNTDQQVALELLRELSYQRQQNNIQHNRWTTNSSITHNENFSLPTPISDTNYRNIARFSNKSSRTPRGISGSDASESGITSDEDDNKVLNQMMKNLTPSSSGVGVYPPLRSSPQVFVDPSNNPCSPVHVSNAVAQNQHIELCKDFPKDMNIVASASKKERAKLENQHQGNKLSKKRQGAETQQLRNYITSSTSCDSPSAPSNSITSPSTKSNSKLAMPFEQHSPIGDKANNNRRQTRKSPRRNLVRTADEKSRFSAKMTQNVASSKPSTQPVNGIIQEPVSGFEAIVSSSLREVLLCFESADYSLTSTSQILDNLLHSIMRQVQFHSSTLGFSSNFVSSIDAQLKATLRSFYGKTLPAIRQELAAAVTQVLIQEYCSLFTQQDSPLEARQNHIQESNCANDFRPANRSDSETSRKPFHPQYVKQVSSHSLFSTPQESPTVPRQGKSANTPWSLCPTASTDGVQTNRERSLPTNMMAFSRDEEYKNEAATGAKNKGAISKNCVEGHSHPEGSLAGASSEVSNCLLVESPLPEASSFPESWVIQRAGSGAGDADGLYSFTESSLVRERDERAYLNVLENVKVEHNDAEADQNDHARNLDLGSLSLPVHDLAEADQSQDPVEADAVDSAIENDHYEASAPLAYSQPVQETKEFALRFMTKKKVASNKDIPEQGLDEVPIRLPSAAEGSSPPVMNGRSSACGEGSEDKISPHRYGPFGAAQSQAAAVPQNESNAAHHTDTASGKGG